MRRENNHTVDTVFSIALICIFAASVLMVLLLGTRIYTSMTNASNLAYNERICMSYIAEKLRHADKTAGVYIGEFDELNAIYIETEYDHTAYHTILYYYDGWLRELFCSRGSVFQKTDGTKIIRAQSVLFSEVEPGFFYVEAVDLAGDTNRLSICLRSGG